MFIETRKSRKGKQVDEETQFTIDKLQESIENSTEVGTQTFQSLFGKEKPGRVRCYGRTVTPSLLKKNEEISLMKMQYDGKISDMTQKMGAMEALLKSMYMQQNPHLSEEEVDEKMREALHNDNIPTPRSSTSTYAPDNQKVRNEDDPLDEQDEDLQDDDDLYYDQDDEDLQYDQDEDLQYDQDDILQDDDSLHDDSHDPQYNECDEDLH
ncbi:eisosome protein SEG2-like [Vicia villosa]|uniref:eisosome protein SEG2-like n=2 Tax=Vicia villosa TaxID=3911 RepID=UPI00273BF9C2|nr:eisosome protein SEG2-like [Vicia villosa]